jgi:hypothetical protein
MKLQLNGTLRCKLFGFKPFSSHWQELPLVALPPEKVVFNRHRLSTAVGARILRYITSFTVFRNNPALKEFIFKKKNQCIFISIFSDLFIYLKINKG